MNKSKPPISIIMSVHNEEKNILRCIKSVLIQNFKNFEFLILDDHSSDRTLNILKNFSSYDKRIKLFSNKKKLGLTKSLNYLIKKSDADYIARIDGDDFWYNNKLRIQYSYLKNSNINLIGCNFKYKKNNKICTSSLPLSQKTIKKFMFYSNPFAHSSVIFKKAVLKNYDEKFIKCQDYDAWSKIVFKKNSLIKNIKRPLIYHSLGKKYDFQTLINSIKVKLNIMKYSKKNNFFLNVHIILFFIKNIFKYLFNYK